MTRTLITTALIALLLGVALAADYGLSLQAKQDAPPGKFYETSSVESPDSVEICIERPAHPS